MKKKKMMVITIIVCSLLMLLFLVIGVFSFFYTTRGIFFLPVGVLGILIAGLMLGWASNRLNELKGEEEDDSGKH